MFDRKVLKDRAKAQMLRSYSKMFLACLIVNFLAGGGIGLSTKRLQNFRIDSLPSFKQVIVLAIIAIISVIAIVFTIFVLSPLRVGLKKFMIDNSKGRAELNALLFPFQEEYGNIVLVAFMKNLFIFLWSLIGIIPTILLGFSGYIDRLVPIFQEIETISPMMALELLGVSALWFVLTLVFSVPAIIKELQYSMVDYMLSDNPRIDWKTALSESKEMMVGNKWAYVKLLLSFILWFIVANVCCFVGNFLLDPYVEATFAELYLELSGQNLAYKKF